MQIKFMIKTNTSVLCHYKEKKLFFLLMLAYFYHRLVAFLSELVFLFTLDTVSVLQI